jgi:hypothetical protein
MSVDRPTPVSVPYYEEPARAARRSFARRSGVRSLTLDHRNPGHPYAAAAPIATDRDASRFARRSPYPRFARRNACHRAMAPRGMGSPRSMFEPCSRLRWRPRHAGCRCADTGGNIRCLAGVFGQICDTSGGSTRSPTWSLTPFRKGLREGIALLHRSSTARRPSKEPTEDMRRCSSHSRFSISMAIRIAGSRPCESPSVGRPMLRCVTRTAVVRRLAGFRRRSGLG